MNPESILNVLAGSSFGELISKFAYMAHLPLTANRYGFNDRIQFQVHQTDAYTLPSQSYLLIKGQLEKMKDSDVQFADNGIAFLLEEIRYNMNYVEVDNTRSLGSATLLKGLASMTLNEYQSSSNSGFAKLNELLDGHGNFSVCVPLKKWLGFFESYDKIVMSAKQELILQRSTDDKSALYSTKTPDTSKVKISDISWMLPYITVSDTIKLALLPLIEKNSLIQVPFRAWEMIENTALNNVTRNNWTITTTTQLEKPRYVLVSFQTNRKNSMNVRNDKYDPVGLRDIKLFLNNEYYPYVNLNLNIATKEISFLYEMYRSFQYSYYHREDYVPALTRKSFLEDNFMIVFDCSFQNDSIQSGAVDVRLEIETTEAMPNGTVCQCLIIHDKIFQYSPFSGYIRRT